MRMLFLGKNDQNRIHHTWRFLREELKKHMEVIEHGRGWSGRNFERDARKLVKMYDPDIIYIERYRWTHLNEIDVPTIMFFNDPHGSARRSISQWINDSQIDMTVHVIRNPNNAYGMHTWRELLFPEHKLRYLPYPVNIHVFKDYGYDREYDIGLFGRIARSRYPLRSHVRRKLLLGDNPNPWGFSFFRPDRPKRSWNFAGKKYDTYYARDKYARAVANCKTMVFGSSVYKYAVAKYVEGMACQSLVVADAPGDAEELHFIPDWNFIEVDAYNVFDKIQYYIKHEDERLAIARRGRETVEKYHSCEVRVQQLLSYIDEVMA